MPHHRYKYLAVFVLCSWLLLVGQVFIPVANTHFTDTEGLPTTHKVTGEE